MGEGFLLLTNFPTLGPSKLYSSIDVFPTSNIIGPLSQTEKSCTKPLLYLLSCSGVLGHCLHKLRESN